MGYNNSTMIKRILLFYFLLMSVSLVLFFSSVRADELSDIEKQLDDLKHALDLSQKATTPLEANLGKLETSLKDLQRRIAGVEEDIIRKEKEVKSGEESLAIQQTMLEQRIRSFYKSSFSASSYSLQLFVSNIDLGAILRLTAYRKSVIDEDKRVITEIVLYIKSLEEKKKQLEEEKIRLAVIKTETDKQAEFLKTEIAGAKKYQASLGAQIAQLSSRQQELIAQKLASLNISRSAASMGRCDSDLTNGRDPGFSPRFAFFTFGVPNRVGLNQWGAYGRANSGQGYEQILHAYYNFDEIKGYDTNIQIKVEGYGSFSLDDYVKRIYEVPINWPADALKAQAIAARSYALAYTGNGSGTICATESCQVFKPDPKGGAWEQAVNDTSGKVMVQGGNPIKAWFSSTHGGFVLSSSEIGWSGTSWTKHNNDTKENVSSLTDLRDSGKAYDKESPWFYCDWGSRTEYNKTAWLKSEEIADVVNVIMLARKDSSVTENLYQVDKPNPAGKETWGIDRVKQELRSRSETPFNSINDVSLSADIGGGRTTNITFNGDAGSQSFDGNEFKNFFNLRAPANIQIVGPLYNIEKK